MDLDQAASGPASRAPERKGFISLASRLALVTFALVATVSVVIALELARRERGHYVEAKRNAAEMLSELFAASITAALDFGDEDAIGSSLGMLSQNREVIQAAVWSVGAAAPLMTFAGAHDGVFSGGAPASGVHVADTHIDVVRSVASPTGKVLGTAAIRVSLATEIAAFASARRRIFWLAFGLSAVVAGLLVAVMRRTIVTPLAELEKAAKQLAHGELTLVMEGRDDEVGRLGRTFNVMVRAIAEREEHISTMNARLQGLLDNMRQAIVVFDGTGNLAPERSRLAREVFIDAAEHDTISDLLYPPFSASEVEREAFRVWLCEIAEAAPDELEELFSLAPREVNLIRDGEERVLELEFREAPSEGSLKRFMLLATDVTAQRHLERTAESQARSHQKQLTAMRRLLAGGGQVFVRFLRSARERLVRARGLLDEGPRLTTVALEDLFRFAHTLRAEARSFDLERIEALVSELEVSLAGARHTPLDSPVRHAVRQRLTAGFERLGAELDDAERIFVESSPIGARVLEQVTVARKDVEELSRLLAGDGSELGRVAARLAARPFGELIGTLPEDVRRWSVKEGKIVELIVNGRDALVPATLCECLGGVLGHLLSNAVAHGIEKPEQRRAKHKPESGRIELSCDETPQGVVIAVSDDGAGFDLPALTERAQRQGHPPAQALELASLAGLTTREIRDELAGNGVGLGAVREALSRVGYAMRLDSNTAEGARISISPVAEARDSRPPKPARQLLTGQP